MNKEQSDKRAYLIEEYKALNHEIDQNNRDVFTTLQVSLTVSTAIFTVAFTETMNESYRWLCVLLPWLILFPSTLVITQRIRHTWIIGRYIERRLEKYLPFRWEEFKLKRKMYQNGGSKINQVDRGKKNFAGRRWATFAGSTTNILLIAQIICIKLSFISLLPVLLGQTASTVSEGLKVTFSVVWLLLSCLIISSVCYQQKKVDEVNRPNEILSEEFLNKFFVSENEWLYPAQYARSQRQ